jgi:hypothetical protein
MPSTPFLDDVLRGREMKVGKNHQIGSKTKDALTSHLPGDWIRLFREKLELIHRPVEESVFKI